MKCSLFTELDPEFLVVGLGLHKSEEEIQFTGKLGRNEILLVSSEQELKDLYGDTQIICIGKADAGPFRATDVLMAGSDELLDRAFRALDEMEQRGVVVNVSDKEDPHHVNVTKDWLTELEKEWETKGILYLCLFMVDPIDSEGLAKLVTLARKVLS